MGQPVTQLRDEGGLLPPHRVTWPVISNTLLLSNTPWLTVEDALGLVPAQPVPGAAHRGGVAGAGAGAQH